MATISAVLIVKNEEALLGRCLESLKELDEIIILDTGSTDGTEQVIRKFAEEHPDTKVDAHFGEYQWNDNFAEARNKAQAYATGDWILVVDADEVLDAKAADIRDYVQRLDPAIEVVAFWVQSLGGHSRHHSTRLYRRSEKLYWLSAVHNYLSKVADIQSDFFVRAGYSPAHKQDPDRALRMLERAVLDEPKSSRMWYYLGREYGYKKRWAESENALRQCLKISTWGLERQDAHLLLARALWFQRKGPAARLECLRAIGMNPEFKEALLFMGDMSYPAARKAWHRYAETATQENLLFARCPSERR